MMVPSLEGALPRVAEVGRVRVDGSGRPKDLDAIRAAVEEAALRSGFFAGIASPAQPSSREVAMHVIGVTPYVPSFSMGAEWRLVDATSGASLAIKSIRSECVVRQWGRVREHDTPIECVIRENIAAGLRALAEDAPAAQ